MMKLTSKYCLILLVLLIASAGNLFSQNNKLPPFRMMQANNKVFNAAELPQGKPILLVYFDPTCDHCRAFTKDCVTNINALKGVSIAMVTYVNMADVKQFIGSFNLHRYTNIFIGSEGSTYFLRDYFRIVKMPFVALFNKEGDFIEAWSQPGSVRPIIDRLKKLR